MTGLLRDAFGELVDDEPPMRLAVADLVVRGRRRKARRRWIATASVAAVVVSVVGLGSAYGAQRPSERGQGIADAPVPPQASPDVSIGTGPAPATTTRPTGTPPPSGTATSPGRSPTAAPPQNDLADPGFENDPVSWAVFGPATVLAPDPLAHGGARSVRITTTSTAAETAGVTSRPVLVTTTAGTTYTASCWVRATGRLLVYVQLQEYTKGWVRVADPAKSPRLDTADPGTWYRLTVTYTATQTGNQLPLSVFGVAMTATGPTLYVDDCTLTRAP